MSIAVTNTTIPTSNLFVPTKLGNPTIVHDGREFCVIDSKGIKSTVQRANLDKDLRGVSTETLQKMLDVGYLSINKIEEDYTLRFNGRLPGGGILGGCAVFVLGKVAGGAMILAGAALAPVGGAGVALIAAGTATMAATTPVAAAMIAAPTP